MEIIIEYKEHAEMNVALFDVTIDGKIHDGCFLELCPYDGVVIGSSFDHDPAIEAKMLDVLRKYNRTGESQGHFYL